MAAAAVGMVIVVAVAGGHLVQVAIITVDDLILLRWSDLGAVLQHQVQVVLKGITADSVDKEEVVVVVVVVAIRTREGTVLLLLDILMMLV